MKSILLLWFSVIIGLYATYYDSDIDGVEDRYDLCENTPFDVLVDPFGCGVNSIGGKYTFKIGTDIGFDTVDARSTMYNFAFQYHINHWTIGLSNTDYIRYDNNVSSRESGDIYAYVGYEMQFESLSMLLFLGTKLAIAKESVGTGENDYYVGVQGATNIAETDYSILGTFSYTVTGDTSRIYYEDVWSYSIGLGYTVNEKYYTSLSYESSDSIYEETERYKALLWSNHYTYNNEYFVELEYMHGLDRFSYAHVISLKIGLELE